MRYLIVSALFAVSLAVATVASPAAPYAGAWASAGEKEPVLFLYPDGAALLYAPCIGAQGRWSPTRSADTLTMDLKDADGVVTHYTLRRTDKAVWRVVEPRDSNWAFHRVSSKLPRK